MRCAVAQRSDNQVMGRSRHLICILIIVIRRGQIVELQLGFVQKMLGQFFLNRDPQSLEIPRPLDQVTATAV